MAVDFCAFEYVIRVNLHNDNDIFLILIISL